MIRQAYTNAQSNVLTWTANGGVLTTPYDDFVNVYAQGMKLSPAGYTITPNTAPGQSSVTINPDIHIDGNNYEIYLFE